MLEEECHYSVVGTPFLYDVEAWNTLKRSPYMKLGTRTDTEWVKKQVEWVS